MWYSNRHLWAVNNPAHRLFVSKWAMTPHQMFTSFIFPGIQRQIMIVGCSHKQSLISTTSIHRTFLQSAIVHTVTTVTPGGLYITYDIHHSCALTSIPSSPHYMYSLNVSQYPVLITAFPGHLRYSHTSISKRCTILLWTMLHQSLTCKVSFRWAGNHMHNSHGFYITNTSGVDIVVGREHWMPDYHKC